MTRRKTVLAFLGENGLVKLNYILKNIVINKHIVIIVLNTSNKTLILSYTLPALSLEKCGLFFRVFTYVIFRENESAVFSRKLKII